MKSLLSILSILFFITFSLSCSEDELSFEKTDPEPEFKLFTMLDDYPALRSAFNSVDQYRFNDLLCEAMNDIPGDVKAVMEVVEDLLVNKQTDTLNTTRSILYRILNQDKLDKDPLTRSNDPGYDAMEFPYYDMISEEIDPATNMKINLIKPILAMQRKMFGYINYKFSDVELEEAMTDMIAHLRDDDANVMKVLFEEIMSKIYLQANENILVNDHENKYADYDDKPCGEGTGNDCNKDTGVGNAVRGSDTSLSGQEDEMKDAAVREAYYEVLREAGKMMSATIKATGEEKNYSTVVKELICNLERHFTKGGEIYESNNGNNDYHRGYVEIYEDENGEKRPRIHPALNEMTGRLEYVNAELSNMLQELMVFLPSLFKRSDRPLALAYDYPDKADPNDPFQDKVDPARHKYYFISRLFEVLRGIGFDPENSNIEETLYKTIRIDMWGRDRLDPELMNINPDYTEIPDPDADEEGYKAALYRIDEQLVKRPHNSPYMQTMFSTINGASNFGWDDVYWHDRDLHPEIDNGHGPYKAAGIFPIASMLCNLGLYPMPEELGFFELIGLDSQLMGLDLFELAMQGKDFDCDHLSRRSWEFNAWHNMYDTIDPEDPECKIYLKDSEDKYVRHRFQNFDSEESRPATKWGFDMTSNHNAIALFPVSLASDCGVPWGGNKKGDDGNIQDEYKPYCPDGRGEPDLCNLFFSIMLRSLWDGEGPYYSKEGMKVDGNVYTYLRPDGREYVRITKPNSDKPLGESVNNNDPYCEIKDRFDIDIDDNVKNEILTDELIAFFDEIITIPGLEELSNDEFGIEVIAVAEELYDVSYEAKNKLDELFRCLHKYQQRDDWEYFFPVVDGGFDRIWEADDPGYKEEYAGQRKNCRYYDKQYTDYYMIHMDDVLFLQGEEPYDVGPNLYDVFTAPDESIGIYEEGKGAGLKRVLLPWNWDDQDAWSREETEDFRSRLENFTGGRVCTKELIPEKCIERECETATETLYRNIEWWCSEKKFAIAMGFPLAISAAKVLDGFLADLVYYFHTQFPWAQAALTALAGKDLIGLWDELIAWLEGILLTGHPWGQGAMFLVGESNGGYGMGQMRMVRSQSLGPGELGDRYSTCGCWNDKRDYSVDPVDHPTGVVCGGQSFIPGDARMNVLFDADDLTTHGMFLGTGLLVSMYEMSPVPFIECITEYFTSGPNPDALMRFIFDQWFENGLMMGGAFGASMASMTRITFPTAVDPRDSGKRVGIIGSRKGDLLKIRDKNWRIIEDKNSEEFIKLDDPKIDYDDDGIHPEWGFEVSEDDPNWPNRFNFMVELFLGFLMAQRDAAGPFFDNREQFENYWRNYLNMDENEKVNVHLANNKWNPTKGFLDIVVSTLTTPHLYFVTEEDGWLPQMCWLPRLKKAVDRNGELLQHDFFDRTFQIDSPYPISWMEREYFQHADLLNPMWVFAESDPAGTYHDTPKRCDGMLALLTEYDMNRPIGKDNPPNTRLITKLFKLGMLLSDPKFSDRPSNYDDNNYSTWSTSDKIRYGTEQLLTSIKPKKGDRMWINEKIDARLQYWPQWFQMPDYMFSDYGIREEEIDLNKILEELIGSDESGKGLAIIPDSRPNPEDWKNFHLFFDSFGELLSNDGETGGRFNIMEDLIDLMEIMNKPSASDEMLKGLRHSIGSIFTVYNESTGKWEYPNEVLHILTEVVPDILETFKGRYSSLCKLTESLLREEGFLEYFIYTLDSDYSGREIFEQLHAFLGEDYIARHDSFFWEDFAELLTNFADMITTQSNAVEGWARENPSLDNEEVIMSAEPFDGLGELLSW